MNVWLPGCEEISVGGQCAEVSVVRSVCVHRLNFLQLLLEQDHFPDLLLDEQLQLANLLLLLGVLLFEELDLEVLF